MVSDETVCGPEGSGVNAASAESDLRLEAFLPYRLSIASNLVSQTISRAYARLFGLSIPQWRLVAVLAETGGGAQQALVQRTRMDKVTVSRAAAALVGRGLVRRLDAPADRRSRLLVLSSAGRSLHADVAPQALKLEARLFGDFKPEELARFREALARLETAASDLLAAEID